MHNSQSRILGPTQVHNVHQEDDVAYAIQLCRWILKPIGIWHLIYGSSSQKEKFVTIAVTTMCFFILCFVLIPSGIHTLFREKNMNIKLKLFGAFCYCLVSTIKYCYLVTRGAAFGKCIQHMEDDWQMLRNQVHRSFMLKNVLIGRKITTLSALFVYTGGLSYNIIIPLSVRRKINENYTIKSLAYPGYDLFFDPTISPIYEIVFCIHCLHGLITYNIITAGCTLATIFVTHACGQMQILIALLNDLIEGKENNDTTMTKRLSVLVKHHVRMLRFSGNMAEVLREICLLELVASTLIICLLEYYCIMEWESSDATALWTYFILLISYIFNILIFCYIGELLVEQYSKIGVAVYDIKWYNLSANKTLDLIMIIVMSKYPPKLMAGKFYDLSIYTFGVVLKTSAAYLNLLLTII